jgi:uncharacterized tellurite resistance protein B-like protein
MLLDRIRALLQGQSAAAPVTSPDSGPDPVHVAACTLMLDIAYADGEFSAPERAHLEGVLARHFALPADVGRELIALCERERAQAVDHFQFTRVLREQYDVGQKMVLAEIMWGLVLADGQVADHEHYLTRKIANLLELEPGYLSSAKQSAQQRVEAIRERTGE